MNTVPFPDPVEPTPSKAGGWRKLLVMLVMAAVGMAFGAAVATLAGRGTDWLGTTPLKTRIVLDGWHLLLLPLSWFVVVLAHELGHLFGGRLSGMRPLMLFAGPLQVDFGTDGRPRLRRNRVKASFGGLAVCSPRADTGRGAYALLVAGGPLASFAFALVLAPMAWAVGGWLGGALFATALMSTMIGLITLVPVRAGGFMSDGGQLVGLARGDDVTRQRLALASLTAQSYAGTRPRDWDPALLAAATVDASDPTLRQLTRMLRAFRLEDEGRIADADALWLDVARQAVAPAAADIAPAFRGATALAIATWIATHRGDAAAARRWLAAAEGGFADPAQRAHAEAVVAWREGDGATARARLAAARAALPQLHDRGGAVMLSESLDRLAREIDAPRVDAPVAA